MSSAQGIVVGALTEAQLEALRWIDGNAGYSMEWTDNGRPARNSRSTWSHLRIRGRAGQILIARGDLKCIAQLIEMAPLTEHTIFRVSEAGRQVVLTERRRGR